MNIYKWQCLSKWRDCMIINIILHITYIALSYNNLINNSKKKRQTGEQMKTFSQFPFYEIGNYGFLWTSNKQMFWTRTHLPTCKALHLRSKHIPIFLRTFCKIWKCEIMHFKSVNKFSKPWINQNKIAFSIYLRWHTTF